MYISDLGWCSVDSCINSSSDDVWIAYRLKQIVQGAPSNQLISRWDFKTQNASKFSYIYHLITRIASYAVFILPALLVTTTIGERAIDYLIDRAQCLYSKIRGTQDFYNRKKQITQLFLTLAVAEERLLRQESVDQKLCGPSGRKLYPNHKPIQANTLNHHLLRQAIQQTINSLSEEDLKTLLCAIQIFPKCQFISPRLQKEFTLEAIKRCTGKIVLPTGLNFNGEEINVFIHTCCSIDLNKASFSNVPHAAFASLEKQNTNSKNKGIFL